MDGQFLPHPEFHGGTDIHHARQPQIGLVAAINSNRLVIAHAGKRGLDFMSSRIEGGGQKSLDHFPHPLGLRIRHLQIDLGEFGLAIGTQVFIAEAAHDLKVPVEP